MIRTRKDPADEIEIVGTGNFIMALDTDQLELMGALLGMVKLGPAPYQQAALKLLNYLEELSGDSEFSSYALGEVMPVLEVRDSDSFDIIAIYDDDHIFEFVV